MGGFLEQTDRYAHLPAFASLFNPQLQHYSGLTTAKQEELTRVKNKMRDRFRKVK
jgi:hypothetical protein